MYAPVKNFVYIMTLIHDVIGIEINKHSLAYYLYLLNCKNKEFTYKIQTIFWDHIEYNIYSGTQKHKYFDWSAESLESSAIRDVQQ